MYPAVIIIIVCAQIGQEAYTARQERSHRYDLTTVEFPVIAGTFETSQFTTASQRGKESTMSPPTPVQ
jgi:hypothetical protein